MFYKMMIVGHKIGAAEAFYALMIQLVLIQQSKMDTGACQNVADLTWKSKYN